MSVNVPLLRKYVEWVEEQDKLTENREWWQESFRTQRRRREPFCQTTFCIAGKVVTDAGWVFSGDNSIDVFKDGENGFVDSVAAELLGLDDDLAWRLFDGENTAADVRRVAEDLAGERL